MIRVGCGCRLRAGLMESMAFSGGHYGVLIVGYWSLEIVIENWVMGGCNGGCGVLLPFGVT